MLFPYHQDLAQESAASGGEALVDVEFRTECGAGGDEVVLEGSVDELDDDRAVFGFIRSTETVRYTNVTRFDDKLQLLLHDIA